MSITTKITVTCSGATNGKPCNHTFVQEGENVTKRSTKLAARKEGWFWRRKATQLCAEHRPSAVRANGKASSKKSTSKAASKPVAKKAKALAVVTTKKANRAVLPLVAKKTATPFVGGQSIGKLAKNAKS